MIDEYKPFFNLPPLSLIKLDADLRELAKMRAIEGEYPELATRHAAQNILDATTPYILYMEDPPTIRPLDHVLQRIKSACECLLGLTISQSFPAADEIRSIADRLKVVASIGESNSEAEHTTTVIKDESDVRAEFRLRGSAAGQPLTVDVIADDENYAVSGPYLTKHYKGPRLKLGRKYIYHHAEVAALADAITRNR